MYCKYYGFEEPPFNITPDPRYLFLSETHQEALQHLLFGVRERKGFIQLTGEIGSGKTTVCRALFEQLDANCRTALVLNPRLTESQLLRAIMREFQIPNIARDRLTNYERLNDWLLERLRAGQDVVLVIDEAQNLPSTLLEMVRLLSNLETDNRKLIQTILIGQPELRDMLDAESLQQLRQRITIRYHLAGLNETETRSYLEHRMSVAGGSDIPIFEPRAIRRIYRYSRGIPRLINAVSDKALLAGFVYRTDRITAKLAKLAERELEGKQP